MRYLTLEMCKHHVYVDHNEDDALIELYATAAENGVENYLECELSSLEKNGELPQEIVAAMLMFFGSLYANREGFSTIASQPSASIMALLRKHKAYGIKK
jgi:hypothetical protein